MSPLALSRIEQIVADQAWRKGFALQRTENGFVLTSGRGNGIVRATPATLDDVAAFLDRQEAE